MGPGLSMRKQAEEPAKEAAAAALGQRHQPYDTPEVHAAWQAYIVKNEHRPAIKSELLASFPTRTDGDLWTTVVGSHATADLFAKEMDSLIPFMRQQLANDAFNLEIRVDSQELGPKYWSDTKVLQHLVEERQEFAQFCKAFRLTLS